MRQTQEIAIVACCPDPSGNPRPNRAIELLSRMGYRVVALSSKPKGPVQGLDVVFPILKKGLWNKLARKPFSVMLRFSVLFRIPGNVRDWLWLRIIGCGHYKRALIALQPNVILVESLILLPFCLTIARQNNARVILDAREYYPREFESSLKFRVFDRPEKKRLLRKYLPQVSAMSTVCDGLAAEYKQEFGIDASVVRSTPMYKAVDPCATVSSPIRLVHHGGANPDRCLEKMIDVVKILDGVCVLDFYLVGNPAYLQSLKDRARSCLWIRFLEPVAFNDINGMLQGYDMGFYILEPTSFNNKFALPNKFFEFIQARIPVAIGPSPEMKALVEQFRIGVVADSFEATSMVELLKGLSNSEIVEMKANTQQAAIELSWERESKVLEKLVLG